MKDTPRDGVTVKFTVYDDARFFKFFLYFSCCQNDILGGFYSNKKNLLQRLYKRPSCIVG